VVGGEKEDEDSKEKMEKSGDKAIEGKNQKLTRRKTR